MEQPINDSPETTELKKQVAELRRQTTMLYFGLALLSITLAGFVGLQERRASKDLENVRPQATQVIEANKKESAAIQAFVSQLEAYGKTHPEYAQRILARYGVGGNAPASNTPAQPAALPPK